MVRHPEGTNELVEHELDVVRTEAGLWMGPGADILQQAIDAGMFHWPRRIERLLLIGVVIEVGDIHRLASWLNQDVASAQRHLEEYWPTDEHQSIIPTCMPFRLVTVPGARIRGRLLVEKGTQPEAVTVPFLAPPR